MRSMVEGAGGSSKKAPPPPPTQPSLRRLRKLACDGRFPSPAYAGEDERAPGAARSSRDLPGGHRLAALGVFTVFQHDAHGEQLVADAVGLLEVLRFARGCTG